MEPLVNFLKRTGIGLLYITGFPVIIIGFILFLAYGLIIFVFLLIKSLFAYLLEGKDFFSPFSEDIRAETKYQQDLQKNPPIHKSSLPKVEESGL
jgi:hypothetical protein